MLGYLRHVSGYDYVGREHVPFLTSGEEDFRKTRAFWRSSTRLISIGGPFFLSSLRRLVRCSSGKSMIESCSAFRRMWLLSASFNFSYL